MDDRMFFEDYVKPEIIDSIRMIAISKRAFVDDDITNEEFDRFVRETYEEMSAKFMAMTNDEYQIYLLEDMVRITRERMERDAKEDHIH
jgi:hypothetical protein